MSYFTNLLRHIVGVLHSRKKYYFYSDNTATLKAANHLGRIEMTNEPQSDWQVARIRADTVEIKHAKYNDLKYMMKATKVDVRLQAFENDELLEEMYVTRAMHEIILDSSDGPKFLRLAINPSMDTTTTHITLDDEAFVVKSASSEHGIRLIGELKKRVLPTNTRIRLLVSDLKREGQLLSEVKRHTNFGPSIMTKANFENGIVVGCVTVCVLCGWGHYPSCVGCAICVEM